MTARKLLQNNDVSARDRALTKSTRAGLNFDILCGLEKHGRKCIMRQSTPVQSTCHYNFWNVLIATVPFQKHQYLSNQQTNPLPLREASNVLSQERGIKG